MLGFSQQKQSKDLPQTERGSADDGEQPGGTGLSSHPAPRLLCALFPLPTPRMLCAPRDEECEIPATLTRFWMLSLAAACPPRAHWASPCPAQRAGAAVAQGVLDMGSVPY